jgi:hypothetical protein
MSVRVHTCYSLDLYERKPDVCACRKEITAKNAREWVKTGLAEWVVLYDKAKPYRTHNQICMSGKKKATPRVATIEKAHMERAYLDGDLEEQERIKEYGKSKVAFIVALMRYYDEDEHRAAERKYFGRDISIVDGGDTIKPLEKIDDQSEPVVAGRSEESSNDLEVSGGISSAVVLGSQS